MNKRGPSSRHECALSLEAGRITGAYCSRDQIKNGPSRRSGIPESKKAHQMVSLFVRY